MRPARAAPRPGQDAVNDALARIEYPSTHQYTVEDGRVRPSPQALPRLLELVSVLPNRQWSSMIDIGCGKAMFLLWAWQRLDLQRLTGVDDAERMVTAARMAAMHLRAPATILHGSPVECASALDPADLVTVLHCYHYLYFGSLSGSVGQPSHEWWFELLASITSDCLVFANPLELSDKQTGMFRERGADADALARYCPRAILDAARRHFAVTRYAFGGARPYLLMRRHGEQPP